MSVYVKRHVRRARARQSPMGRVQIGSQNRETLKASGYKLISRPSPGEVVLESDIGQKELWVANDDYAGYVIEIGGWGYEFVRSVGQRR